jgi:gliding motility-associated protein GldL
MLSKLAHYFETDKGKRVKNMIIGLGAAIVLIGALFKILHLPGAGFALTLGMSVEAGIFALQGVLPPHADYYWEKVYPGLNISPEIDHAYAHDQELKEGTTISQQLDDMMEENNIESELIERLGTGLKKFGDTTNQLADMSNAAAASDEFADNARSAAGSLSNMRSVYDGAAESVRELAESSSGAKEYHEQVQLVAKNLSSLNSMYELELQDTNNHMKAMNQFYGTLTSATEDMNASLEDARKYREEIARLANNLSSLNSVYGNMLSAMNMGQGAANVQNNG